MNCTLYKHPDGFTLACTDGALIATDDCNKTVSLPIGSTGLKELGLALLLLSTKRDEKFMSECAGAVMGKDLNGELLAQCSKPLAEAFCATHDELYCPSKLEQFDAADDFTGAVMSMPKIGITNLPALEQQAC